MATIVTRAGKGSALTHTEVDNNFINLNTDKIEAAQSVTLTNKTISGSNNTLSNIGNSSLANSSVTIGSTSVSLGSTATTVSGLTLTSPTVNTPTVSGGTINNASVGATTPSTGAFTTLSASSTVSGTGFSTYLASPPAIGGTAAAAGSFTTLSATGVTTVQAGTAAAPAITTSGDTNTGIYFPAADTIAFSEGGVESMRIDSAGNVGIGTSSPGALLNTHIASASFTTIKISNSVTGNGSADAFDLVCGTSGEAYVYNRENQPLIFGTNNTERMRIDSSGNVGIGNTDASYRLDVRSGDTGSGYAVRIRSNATATQARLQFTDSGATSENGFINVTDSDIMSFATGSTVQASITAAGLFQFNSGYGSVATAYGCRAWVNFNGTGTVAIRASGNVSSITDNGVGDYTVNFTTAMSDANYCPVGISAGSSQYSLFYDSPVAKTTSAYRLVTLYANTLGGGGAAVDSVNVQVAIFR